MNPRVVIVMLCLLLSAASIAASGTIIDNVDPTPRHISPNGDGVADTMIIRYDLVDTATAVYLLILESDSVTVVDSLVVGVSQGPSAQHMASWDGTTVTAARAPEDSYLVFLKATNEQGADSTYRKVTIDITAPQVIITDVFKTPFAPGSPDPFEPSQLTIEYATSDPAPSEKLRVRMDIIDPAGSLIDTLLANSLVPANGSHIQAWDGASAATDGNHEVRIFVTDQAANKGDTRSSFDVDLDSPQLTITSLESNSNLQAVPDSLFGRAWDKNGIRSLSVRYSGGDEAFEPVQSTMLEMDTVLFAVQLSDSVTEQDTYSLGFRAVDNVGRETIELFAVTFDSIAPAPPVLDQPVTPTRNPTVLLDGTTSPDTDVMRIFRNGAPVDTIFPNAPVPELPYQLSLLVGENRVYAIAADAAANTSARSNEITVVFDSSPGLVISQPFSPNDAFQVNLARPARLTLRIFDLGGNLVERLRHLDPASTITISWDGLNGDGEQVKKGPLVAVAEIQYEDGGNDVLREIFLFQP